jgi:hypothetical protein
MHLFWEKGIYSSARAGTAENVPEAARRFEGILRAACERGQTKITIYP